MAAQIIDNRNLALQAIQEYLPENPVTCEIGFFRGAFSKVIVATLKPKLHIVIDTFSAPRMISGDKDGKNIQYQDMRSMEQYSKSLGYKTIKGTSDKLHNISRFIDFIYIDADHSYDWVLKDLNNARHRVKSGIIAGHDYCPVKFKGCYDAVNEFCKTHNLDISIVTNDGCPSYFIKV